MLASIRDFADQGVVTEPSKGDWIRNGDADVAIAAYAADRLSLDVRAREAALVATSIPAWPGWRVELGGQSIPIATYNHGFVAFRVAPGRHRVELRYRPLSVTLGAVVSAVSGLIALGIALRRRAPG